MHYTRRLRRGTTTPDPYKKPRTLGVCAQCDRPARIRDMCNVHYQRWIRSTRRENGCTVDGCDDGQYSKQMCHLHYSRMKRTGTTDSPVRAPHDRFWEKVEKTSTCWLWTAAKFNGYGVFGVSKEVGTVSAHRWAYAEANGPIPEGMTLDHLCRTPACVRPDHLEPVTPSVNAQRMWQSHAEMPPHCMTCTCSVDG